MDKLPLRGTGFIGWRAKNKIQSNKTIIARKIFSGLYVTQHQTFKGRYVVAFT